MITRDATRAARESYDVVIIGGGIYGVCMLLESARRGLKTLLLERADFGGLSSWNTGRIIHGGIRYLQRLEVCKARHQAQERAWFLRQFPDLVRPVTFVMPLYGRGLKRPGIFRIGSFVNDLISYDRNDGLPEDCKLPAGGLLTASETVEMFPEISRKGLVAAGFWSDAMLASPQRLIMEILHWACALDAVALNYVEADGLVMRSDKIVGLEAHDQRTGEVLRFETSVVFNCAGPLLPMLATRLDTNVKLRGGQFRLTKALVRRKPRSGAALAVEHEGSDRHVFFTCPCGNNTIVGGLHTRVEGPGDESFNGSAELGSLLDAMNTALPGLDLIRDDVLRVWSGVLPAAKPGSTQLAPRAEVYDHGRKSGPDGLVSISGPKFSSARLVADYALRNVSHGRWRALHYREASERPLPSRLPVDLHDHSAFLTADDHTAFETLRTLIETEAVTRYEDLLLRRTDWVADGSLEQEIKSRIGELVHGSEFASRLSCSD